MDKSLKVCEPIDDVFYRLYNKIKDASVMGMTASYESRQTSYTEKDSIPHFIGPILKNFFLRRQSYEKHIHFSILQ